MYHLKIRSTDNLRAINTTKRQVTRIEKIRFFTYETVSNVIKFNVEDMVYRFSFHIWGVVDLDSTPDFTINVETIAGYERFKDEILARVITQIKPRGVLKMIFPYLCDLGATCVALCISSSLNIEHGVAVHLEMGAHEYTIKKI